MNAGHARLAAGAMRRVAEHLSAFAHDPLFPSDSRYLAAVGSDHALEIAEDFEELARQIDAVTTS